MHDVAKLIQIFDGLFAETENTKLVMGEDEPIYLPANDETHFNQVVFAHGFFSSALHEIAHWCIAGKNRRKLTDYGYWYDPEGRTIAEQEKFAAVEARPQALEWILSKACQLKFVVSIDNLEVLNEHGLDSFDYFKQSIKEEVEVFLNAELPTRAQLLYVALAEHFDGPPAWQDNDFLLDQL